jgi:hypothetical protein
MKHATKSGVAVACKKEDRKEVTAEEESLLWEKGLSGGPTAESLLHTVCSTTGNRPWAKIISFRGNPLGNRFSVIQCIVPWILDYHKKFPSKKLAKHRENG